MLRIVIPDIDLFDETLGEEGEFVVVAGATLDLEHSLVSLSKWERKFQKPFLGKDEKTTEETYGYVEAMVLNELPSSDVFKWIPNDQMAKIHEYIDSSESATTFTEPRKGRGGRTEIITSELIYYWMLSYNIPFDCETWNLNRLFNLIRICTIKNSKQPKMSAREVAERNRALNEQRKAELGTRG